MQLTKNEAKKIAKTATKIVNEEKYTDYSNDTYVLENTVSYNEMIAELKTCGSRWWANQYGNKVNITGSICNFTIYL